MNIEILLPGMGAEHAFEKVKKFFYDKKRMPTYREIRDRILKTKSMKQTKAFVDQLIEEGLVAKDALGKLLPTELFGSVKKLGYVEAGFPSPAEEELIDTMTLDQWLLKNREATYMLEVRGESMINAGIRPGDTALVERGRSVSEGDIVIACVDGKWTMTDYHRQGKKVVLIPANPKFHNSYPRQELRV